MLAQAIRMSAEYRDTEETARLQHAIELLEGCLDRRADMPQDVGGEDEVVLSPERLVATRGIEARLAIVKLLV
jgi:hypothetical protein